ncbi:MAG: hypothetical protein JNG90_16185 [Planctomycetaceae bacterium]|nr:hypothetical protein [Planctomycetaceae bacterium]
MSAEPLARRIVPLLLIAFGPLASVSLLLGVLCHGTLWDCAAIWHDETLYWNEMAVYHRAGFDGGYTACNEAIARAPWVHFAAHGPIYPALLGTLTRATALVPASIPLIDAALVVAASLLWLAIVRPNRRQAWTAAFVVNTFWPLILYLPTSMQEALHYALALVIAGVATGLIRNPRDKRLQLAAVLVVVAAAQIRVTWGWLLLPLGWVVWQPGNWRHWLALLVGAAIPIGLLYGEAIWLYAPFPNFMGDVLDTLKHDPPAAVAMVARRALKGVGHYLSPTRDTWVQLGLRYQVVLITAAGCYHLLSRQQPRLDAGLDDGESPEALADAATARRAFGFVALNMLSILAFVISFYDIFDWRDYRVVAPHLFVSVLVLAGIGARNWLPGYAVLAVLTAGFALPQFAEFHRPRVDFDQAKIAEFADEMNQLVPFDPQASPWDNTIVIHMDHVNTPLVAGIPPGVGLAPVLAWRDQALPPRSRWLILKPQDLAQIALPPVLEKVAETRLGDLYRRADASVGKSESANAQP